MKPTTPRPGTVTMFTTSWCGFCARLKRQLDDAGIDYDEVDIEQRPEAAEFVRSVNRGNQTVPTVVVAPTGGAEVTMTNPSLAQVKQALVPVS